MRITGDLVAAFNAAFDAVLDDDLGALKNVLLNSPSDIVNVQLTPKHLPSYLSAIGIRKFSLVHITCYLGHVSLLKELIKKGANLLQPDETFAASCMHWAVFGQQKEMGIYLFFDLGYSTAIRNKYGQIPRELFANRNEVWEFLNPYPFGSSRLIQAFKKVIETEVVHSMHSTPVKLYFLLLNLNSFSKIMDSMQSGRYVQNERNVTEMFFSDVRSLFEEGRRFYHADAEMKKILKETKKLLKKEIFQLGNTVMKSNTKALVPVNFTTRALDVVRSIENPFQIIESIRLNCPSTGEAYLLTERQGSESRCFVYPLPTQSPLANVHVKMKFLPAVSSFLPALFVNTQRIQTFTPGQLMFEWTFPVRSGTNLIEFFIAALKEHDGRQRAKKNFVVQTTGEVQQLFTFFILCTNQ